MKRGVFAYLPVALALLLWAIPSYAALSVNPASVVTSLDEGNVSKAFTVINQEDREGRFRAQVRHFVYSLEGSVRQIEPDEHSLAPWIKLNPKEFTLGPGKSRVIRMTVIPPKNLRPGEYWAAIEFEPLAGVMSSASDSAGRTFSFEVVSAVLVPVVGSSGKVTHSGELRSLEATSSPEGAEIAAVLANTGTGRLRLKGTYEILDASGAVVTQGAIGEAVVLPGGERRFVRRAQGTFRPGEAYAVRVRYTSDVLGEDLAGEAALRAKESADPNEKRP